MPEHTTAFFVATVLATFVSEDLTCLGVGLLASSGQADVMTGLAACFLGIFAGDVGLWLAGRLAGRRLLRWRWAADRLPAHRLEQLGAWLDRNCAQAVVAARFLPGTRLPMYLAAGVLGRNSGRFVLWTFLASLVWVPLVVVGVALFGDALAGPLRHVLGPGWLAVMVAGVVLFGAYHVVRRLVDPAGRARLAAKVARLWRWEFWPSWLFYLPLLPYLAWLALRHRSLTVWTSANPGIPLGGVVGESKFAILNQLAPGAVIPSALVPPGAAAERLRVFHDTIAGRRWDYPLVLKPDASQRGAGVKKVNDVVDVEKYLQRHPGAVLVQPYHPGPYEAGVFYYRLPGEENGHIFSITDKVFPVVVGDGRSTLAELVWRHSRYRMQADTFLTRHAAATDRVLAEGEPFRLALAGNHCQGTMFRDGSHLMTPELGRAIDLIARPFVGFFIGRFDIRYSDVNEFKRGIGLAVVELNGATSESTNIYDPSWPIRRAYATLRQQWALLFRVGDANRRLGHEPATLAELIRAVRDSSREGRGDALAD